MKKKILIAFLAPIVLFGGNVVYWITSDIQQQCFTKIKKGGELNFYEKSSIYSINLCICALGWPLSPEATIQQILCTVPTSGTVSLSSGYFSEHEKVLAWIKKNPNATVNKPIRMTWKPDYNEFGMFSAYTFQNMRIGLACNGMYLYKENGEWVISYIQEFAFPMLHEPTVVGPFKFHEGLIRHMQDIGWLYKPHFKWLLDIDKK